MENKPEPAKKKGLALLAHDLREKKLIPTKVLFFAVLSSRFDANIWFTLSSRLWM